MPDALPPSEADRQAAQQQLIQRLSNLDDKGVVGSYANLVRVTGSAEEVVLDFALVPNPERTEERIEVRNRVVLSYFGAKRLLAALHQTVARHEQCFGTVEIDVRKRMLNPPPET